LIAALGLGLLARNFSGPTAGLIILLLGTTEIFWRYAVLPDVFALHFLFLTLVFLTVARSDRVRKLGFLLGIALSVAHHHTVVFVFPLFLYSALRNSSVSLLIRSILCGAVALGLYGLLLLYHPADYGSWGELSGMKDLVAHFLRRDYGTFQLMTERKSGGSWWIYFGEHLVREAWALIPLLVFVGVRCRETLRAHRIEILLLTGCLVTYLTVFEILAGLSASGRSIETFERFLIQPLALFFFGALLVTGQRKFPKPLVGLLLINAGINLYTNFTPNDYRRNTAISDYLSNALNIVPSGSILYTYSDTDGFATYYLKDVLGLRPDVIHMHPSWGSDWGRRKFQRRYPDALHSLDLSIYDSVNFEQFRFFTNRHPEPPGNFFVSRFGLLYEIGQYKGAEGYQRFQCEHPYTWTQRPTLGRFSSFEASLTYDLSYGDCHLLQALELLANGDLSGAREKVTRALELSPLSVRAQERLCEILRKQQVPELSDCERRLELLLETMHPGFYLVRQ
jgi:hypothetical protein